MRGFCAFWLLVVFVSSLWSQVILDVRKYRYQDIIPWITQSNRVFQAIWIDTPFKGYSGRFLPTEAVYDFDDTGDKFQRGSRETFLGSHEEFDEVVSWCRKNSLSLYARVRLFEQQEVFLTKFWDISDFYPDYTVALERTQTHRKLQQIVEKLQKLPVDVWVVDITGLSLSYQRKASQWVKQNFSKALIMGDEESVSTLSASDFWRWQKEIRQTNLFLLPSFASSGVLWVREEDVSSEGVFYYFLARQKKRSLVISPAMVGVCERIESVEPSRWDDIRFVYTAPDHLWGISSKGVVSFYTGEVVRFTNYVIDVHSSLSPVVGTSYLRSFQKTIEGLFLPWSFSLWKVEK
ncbi:MAG: hypothetical protein ACK4HQ_06520 [Brevinematales bacterium]